MNAIVKTFRGPNPRAALDAVKAAFGEEAVILHTREVGGGLWGRKEIEVTAASSADAARGAAPGQKPRAELESEVAALRRVVEELRTELRTSHKEEDPLGDNASPSMARLYRRLMQRGIEPPTAEELVRQAAQTNPRAKEADLVEAVRGLLRARLPMVRPVWETVGRRVVALVGPTGVGKTTTIAKIAARALLEARLKVSLVTVDTYRIGASEHIGRYGDIMQVPTHTARDIASLREAMQKSAESDLVLIDTAGRSDAAAIANQANLLRGIPGIEVHLVLSAASGAREIQAAARRHQVVDAQRLVFSKLDEADGPGSVLAAASLAGLPVSCVTDGQKVPDDLHAAHPMLIDVILGK